MVPLAASGAQALCVLNQADKLAPAEVPAVLASLTRLLQAEGTEAHLLAAPIAVSARTGEGVDVLRDLLAQVAAAKSLSLQRTDAQLHATASQLRTYAGGEGTVLAGAYALEAEQKLVKACYASSQAEQVLEAATASYRRAAGQHTGWILTRWMSRLKADPLRRLHLGQQEETKSASKAEKSAGMLGPDSENAPELVASSLPPLSAAQKAGMANAVRQYSKQMAALIDEPWKRSMKEAALSREAELPELLERDMMRIDYGLSRTRAPWVIFNTLQWIALLSALVGVGWLTLISGMAYLQIQLPPAPTPEGSPVPCRPCFCFWVYCSVSPRRVWAGCSPPWAHATTRVSCGVVCRPAWRRQCSPAWSPRCSWKLSASPPTARRWTFSGISPAKPHQDKPNQDKPNQTKSAQKNPSPPQARRGGILFIKTIYNRALAFLSIRC